MPKPKATKLALSTGRRELLTRICRRRTSSQQQAGRANIILSAASGASNTEIAQRLGLNRNTVRLWRERWVEVAALAEVEDEANDKELFAVIEEVLSDAYRSGTPATFSAEQIVQIVALACEAPTLSKRPISQPEFGV